MLDCPTRLMLERFLAGALGNGEEAGLCAHVEECPACQGELEQLVAVDALSPGPGHPGGDPGSAFDLPFLTNLPAPRSGPAWPYFDRYRAVKNGSRREGTPALTVCEAEILVPGYEILGELGRGAMGVVYKARQLSLGRLTALKVILAGAQAGLDDRMRFRTEAEAAGSLRHPNIVQVYETGEASGVMFFSMEYVEGETLKQRLRGTPQPARTAARLVEAMARAVDCAHQNGIIHRDLKPANVLTTADGTLKIADFGLAKRVGDILGTRKGQLLGTPPYMAPEQFSRKGGAVSPAVDIYALGCILYEVLTGRPPFLDAYLETLAVRVLREDPVAPRRLQPSVPRDLETVCLKCLEKEPSRRYASALDLAADLERFLNGDPVRARRQTAVERSARWARKHKEIAAALLVILLLLLACCGGSLFAAAHFRQMAAEQHRLGLRNGALARQSAVERRKAELMLADMDTEHGLQASEFGRDRDAVLWFAQAARVAVSDPQRQRANLIRAQAWSRRVSRPVGVVRHPDGVPLTLQFHSGNRHLLSTAAPFGGATVVWDLDTEQPMALPGEGEPLAAAWSPDGTVLAVGTASGVTLCRFPGLTESQRISIEATPTLLRFSRDGQRLAIAMGRIVRVWDRRMGEFLTERLEHPALVLTLEFAPDDRVVSASEDGQFRVFALQARGAGPEFTGPHRQFGGRWTLCAPALDPTGKRLISASAASELTWWDPTTHERVATLAALGGEMCDVEPSPDGSRLAVTVENRGVAIVDLARRATVSWLQRGPGGLLFSAFSPDGRSLVVAGAHPEAQQWGLAAGAWMGTPAVEATGFRAAAFLKDGRLLATAGYENQVRVWALPPPEPPSVLAVPTGGAVGRGTFSADSRLLLTRLRGESARVYRIADGVPAGPLLRPDGTLVEAAFTPDAHSVVTMANAPDGGGLVDVWDWSTGRRRSPTLTAPARPLALCMVGSGRVAVLHRDGLLRLLDAATAQEILHWHCGATDQPLEDVGVSPSGDGRTGLVVINGRLQLWDLYSGRLYFDPPHHRDLLYAARSADGRLIASVGADSALRIWNAAAGRQIGPALDHPSWIDGGVDFHPDSRHVLTICKDTVLRVWDVQTGRLAAPPIRPAASSAARFSPDGRVIVSAGADGTVDVWDWRAGRRLWPTRKLALDTDWAFAGNRSVQISPDGRFVAVGGRPELSVLSLVDPAVSAAAEGAPEDMNAWAELVAHHRVDESGALVHLTGEEWYRRWQDFHHQLSSPAPPVRRAR
jgi:WD40 repeat protein/predicted Ser/Thr protein kinase